MALISMAVWDTEENKRSELTEQCLNSILETVDFKKHRLFISDNGSCDITQRIYSKIITKYDSRYNNDSLIIHRNYKNIGTAAAVNSGWAGRLPGEHCIKMDNDVLVHQLGWVDEMQEAIEWQPKIGIIGLKRKDVWESPNNEHPFYKSELLMLPHEQGQRWIVVEKVKHVIGTCQMYNSALLDKIGYLYQASLYGFDDSFAAARCTLAGFDNVFLPHIHISHLDNGAVDYQKWKEEHAGQHFTEYHQIIEEFKNGTRNIYYNPFAKETKH